MLKNKDSTLNKIMLIEIKLEETYLFKKGEEKGEIKPRDKMILTGRKGIEFWRSFQGENSINPNCYESPS
jgi:hypothetical protein